MTTTDPTTTPERTPPDVWGFYDDEAQRWLEPLCRDEKHLPHVTEMIAGTGYRPVRLVPAGSDVAAVLGALNERHAELQKLRLDAVEELNWHTASAYRQNEDRMKAAIDAINEILPTLNQLDAKAEARDA